MPKTSDRAKRSGSDPIIIGSSKIATDSNNDISIVDTSGNAKKIIASEVHLGTDANKVILKRSSSDGKLQLQTTDGSSTSNSEVSGDSGGSGGVTVQEEGSALSTTATTLNFVGSSVTASGSGETKTITISAGTGGTTTVYANINAMTASSPSAGDQALVTANSGLYIYNGGGWYKIATVNTSPTISSPSTGGSFVLATNGSATSIEIVGADVEVGTNLQYSYAVTSGSLGSTATVSSSATVNGTYSALNPSTNTTNRFFKVTPSSNSAHAGAFTLTWSVSDTINAATTVQSFTLQFETFGSTSMQLNAGVYTTGGDHVEVASHSDFALGTNDFTIEGWFYFDGPADRLDYPGNLVGHRGSVGYDPYLFDFRTGGNTRRSPVVWIGGAGGNNAQAGSKTFRYYVSGSDRITSSVLIPELENQWFHLCIVRSSGTTTMYINGTSEGTWSDSTNYDEVGKIWIGRKWNSANSCFFGWISNFRIVNGTAVYTANFTPPHEPLTSVTNTKLLACTKPDAVDDIGPTGHTVTKVGNATHSAVNPFPYTTIGYGSTFFDGNNDRLYYAQGGGNAVTGMTALSDLTVEAWVFPYDGAGDDTTDPSVEQTVVDFTDQLYGGQQMIFGRKRAISNKTPMYCGYNGSNETYTNDTAHNITRGNWVHLAWVKQGTNLRMYKGGSNVKGNNGTSSTSWPATLRVGEISIGTKQNLGKDWEGYISNLRISNNARYTSDFTPSTTPFSSDSNTLLLTCQRSIPAKTTDGATTHPSQGAGNGLQTTASIPAWGTTWTLETWAYFTSTGSYRNIFHNDGGQNWYFARVTNGKIQPYNMGFNYSNMGSTDENTWHHIAATCNNGSFVLYIDGVSVGTATASAAGTNPLGQTGNNKISMFTNSINGQDMTGSLSDSRLVIGTCVYTGAFQRPSGPLTRTGGTYPSNTNVNTSFPSAHTYLLTNQTSSGSITDNSQYNMTMTANGVTVGAGVQDAFDDQGPNSLGLTSEGNVRTVKNWPFNYSG